MRITKMAAKRKQQQLTESEIKNHLAQYTKNAMHKNWEEKKNPKKTEGKNQQQEIHVGKTKKTFNLAQIT